MKPKDIVNTIADKVVPISENKRTFGNSYFYGYAKGGYDVDQTKATWYIDPNIIEPGSELEKMLTYNIAFSAEVVLLLRNYFYNKTKLAPDKVNKLISLMFDATSCAAVRCANRMLYSKPIPRPKHWYNNPKTGEMTMFSEDEVPEGWVRGRGEKWKQEQGLYKNSETDVKTTQTTEDKTNE